MAESRTITVQALARVEGEGALTIRLRDGVVEHVELRIYEPPRFFEAFLRGRAATEVPDITARICGICPVAYQMSSVHALEKIVGVTLPPPLRALRRLLYCGEWIESHVLHVAMLHAPDFLGYEDAIRMAKDHLKEVQLALNLKKAGNEIVRVVGGREIHPVNVRVGGFYRVHTSRGKDENLNAPGAQFVPLAFESPCIPDLTEPAGCAPNRFYAYGVVARLAQLAAAVEIEELESAAPAETVPA